MDKEIFAAVFRLDESVAFFGVEPFYCSCAHILILFYFYLSQNLPFAGFVGGAVSKKTDAVAINRQLSFRGDYPVYLWVFGRAMIG